MDTKLRQQAIRQMMANADDTEVESKVIARPPNTANFLINSIDRNTDYPFASDFVIKSNQSIVNGFFKRMAVQEVVLDWGISNVGEYYNNIDFKVTIFLEEPEVVEFQVPSGWYTVALMLDTLVSQLNAFTAPGTFAIVNGAGGVSLTHTGGKTFSIAGPDEDDKYTLAEELFGNALLNLQEADGIVNIDGTVITTAQGFEYPPNSYITVTGVTPSSLNGIYQIASVDGDEITVKQQNSIDGYVSGGTVRQALSSYYLTSPRLLPYFYVDIVCPQLTYNQELKDTTTDQENNTPGDVLYRWYFAWDQQPQFDAYGFPILQGYKPFIARRFIPFPKQIKWDPKMPIGNLAFTVLGDDATVLVYSGKYFPYSMGTCEMEFSINLLLSED